MLRCMPFPMRVRRIVRPKVVRIILMVRTIMILWTPQTVMPKCIEGVMSHTCQDVAQMITKT